jgi:hypothetical protein
MGLPMMGRSSSNLVLSRCDHLLALHRVGYAFADDSVAIHCDTDPVLLSGHAPSLLAAVPEFTMAGAPTVHVCSASAPVHR